MIVSLGTHSSWRLSEDVLLLFPWRTRLLVSVLDDRIDLLEEGLSATLLDEEGLFPVDELVPVDVFWFRVVALGDLSGLRFGL